MIKSLRNLKKQEKNIRSISEFKTLTLKAKEINEFLRDYLGVIENKRLYVLGSILLVVLIILGIKLIITMNKIEIVVDDINKKVKSLDGLFSIIDMTTDKLAMLSDKVVDTVTLFVKKVFRRKEDGTNNE